MHALLLCSALAFAGPLEELSWLAGTWRGAGDTVTNEEHWTAPDGGMLLGLHRDVRADGRSSFEFLRIAATEEGVVYFASPGGKTPTPFRLAHQGPREVRFENPDHDFPQRISYRLDSAGVLHVRVDGGEGQQPVLEWTWERVVPSPKPVGPTVPE